MRYYIRNFTKIKQVISTNVLSGVVTRYMAGHYTKKFFFEKHLDFLLIFQLTCKESLSDAVQFVQDNKRVKDFVPEISVSQVSRANMNRDYTMFAEIFYYLVDRALSSKKLNLSNEEKEYIKNIKILDSTLIRLCLKYFDWAEYRKNVGAIKIHTLMDLESLCPEKIFMTSGKPVTEIANLYRYRWQIEEFFKWIKQHLKIYKINYYKSKKSKISKISTTRKIL